MKTEIYIRGDAQKVLCLTPENQKEQDFINLWNSVKGDAIEIVVKNFLPEEEKEEEMDVALPNGKAFIFASKEWINNYGEKPIINSNFDILTLDTWSGKDVYSARLYKPNQIHSLCWKNIVGYRIAD